MSCILPLFPILQASRITSVNLTLQGENQLQIHCLLHPPVGHTPMPQGSKRMHPGGCCVPAVSWPHQAREGAFKQPPLLLLVLGAMPTGDRQLPASRGCGQGEDVLHSQAFPFQWHSLSHQSSWSKATRRVSAVGGFLSSSASADSYKCCLRYFILFFFSLV